MSAEATFTGPFTEKLRDERLEVEDLIMLGVL